MTDACTLARRLRAIVCNRETVAAGRRPTAAAYTLKIEGDACKTLYGKRQRQIRAIR